MTTPDAAVLAGLRMTAGLPLAVRERMAAAMHPVRLHGGEWLFRQGEEGYTLYLVRRGRLEILRTTRGQERLVAVLQRGDVVGELALLEGGSRSAGARALRDCDLLALGRDDVAPLLAEPAFASALLRGVTRMLRADPPPQDDASRRTVISVLGHDPGEVSRLVADLRAEMLATNVSVAVVDASDARTGDQASTTDLTAPTAGLLDQLERDHQAVLMDGGRLGDPWGRVCSRQADRVLVLVGPDHPPPPASLDLQGVELVVLGDRPASPATLDGWGGALAPRAHHRVRDGHRQADIGRLARRVTGRSLAVVLSGGGARAMAHIGVLQALEEAGVTVDRFGGTSMGAFIAALAATGRRADDIWALAEQELIPRHPFRDYTVPRVALIRGQRAERMLRRTFGVTDIRQLPRSWFGVSAALADAEMVVHRSGAVWEAVACSMSLPGLAPPRWWNGRVVVDGGVLDNLPVTTMCAQGEGQVIASDVTLQRVFASGGAPDGLPGIVDTLSATMVLSSWQQRDRSHRAARLLVRPEVNMLGLLDFERAAEAVAAGREAARSALAGAGDLLHPAPRE